MKKLVTLILISVAAGTAAMAQIPGWSWAKSARGDGHDYVRAISTDANGTSYVTGEFQGPTDIFENDTLTATANGNFFIAKYDSSGHVLWAKAAVSVGESVGTGIKQDPSGNCVVTGYYQSSLTITFDTITIPSSSGGIFQSAFLVKYDSLGNVMWARNAGASDWIPGNFSVDLDAAGNIYLTGTFADSAFLEKYDAAGNQLLKKYYSGNTFVNNAHPWSISTDAAGNNFITGYFSNPSLVFGTTTLTNANGGYQIFIVKTDSSGNIIWAKNDGVYPSLYKPYISSDGAGNCYITGYFNGTSCMFGSTILLNAGANDIFVVKYNPSGNVVWAKRAGGTHFDLGMGIRTDANGNSYITGFFRGTAYFDNFTLFSANDPEIFVAKYDSSGNVLWAKSAGGSDVDNSNAIGIDAQGNCYIGGNFFSANAYFDIIVLPNSNLSTFPSEVFVAKLGSGTVTGITPIPALVNTENSIVYPNPANDVLTVSVSEFPCGIVLYDVSGREVLSEQLIKESDQIKIKNLLPGIYFYEVKGYDKVVKKGKIVKE